MITIYNYQYEFNKILVHDISQSFSYCTYSDVDLKNLDQNTFFRMVKYFIGNITIFDFNIEINNKYEGGNYITFFDV